LSEIRVGVVGVGNCVSALVQGVKYYKNVEEDVNVPGLMHVDFGGYHIQDIRFVAAFDVNRLKIGRDLAEAIFTEPNCCAQFTEVPRLGVKVLAGPVLDGVASHMSAPFRVYDKNSIKPTNVVEELKAADVDMLLNFLPVGSAEGVRFYADACLKAGCAFVNCMPEFIASNMEWSERFKEAGLPVAGDDIKSQLGATIMHRNLVRLCVERGVRIEETYQLNLGGNTDFQNMTVEERLKTKRVSKTEAVTSLVSYDVPTRIGPSDYVPFLGDKKICYVFLRGRKFGDQPVTITAKLEVEDSPNSAGVVIDVIRAVKLALDRGIAGALVSICSYAFKHPPVQVPDDTAKRWVEEYIKERRKR
jgi:myo-inositol-1-phosphate synthase